MAIWSVIEFCSSFPSNESTQISPSLGILGVLLIIAFVKEPSRGAAEGNNSKSFSLRRWISDVKQISKNRSFIFSTLGTKTVNFTAGAISFWAPEFLLRAQNILQENAPCQTDVCNYNDSMIFGILTVVAGIIGVVAGVEIAKRYKKYNPRADPIVCGFSLLGSAIFLFLAIYLANITLVATYVLIFIGHILLMMNFSISADICLYVVSPARRTTAQAMSIILSRISNLTNRQNPDSARLSFHSLQYALWTCPFVVTLRGGFFLISSCFVEKDCEKAELEDEDCVLEEGAENMALLDNSTKNTPLLSHDVEKGADPQEQDLPPRTGISYTRSIIIIVILFYMNLVTIMVSSIGTAIVPYLQASFKIDDSGIGLINIGKFQYTILFYRSLVRTTIIPDWNLLTS
ncbi:protein spinster homolog 1-like [Anomaloglossus baeobatrachus]|uniref:protein spinster homolog 1-like n=1 Tax=Anomaloglossus baeobatrachus TaxID=238106 RepID=UPI003F50C273